MSVLAKANHKPCAHHLWLYVHLLDTIQYQPHGGFGAWIWYCTLIRHKKRNIHSGELSIIQNGSLENAM